MKHTKTNLLIVDDSEANQIALQACLLELDQNIIFASSAKEALRYVLEYDFAVILLDVQMPIMNGFETAEMIRSREKSSYTPIIFVSAFNKNELDINRGYAMGAVDYIFKPINPVILRSKVKVFVDLFTKSTLAISLKEELKKRKAKERQLELAEHDRLNSIEEMTSALAHELNQPLTTISNYVQGCVHRLKNNDFQKEDLIKILQHTGEEAVRAGAILHRIKNFIRKNKLYCEPVNINDLVLSISQLTEEEAKKGDIQIIFSLCDEIPEQILLDKIQIEQVIINLLRNSIEALMECASPNRHIEIQTRNQSDKAITIKIMDNGPGIDPTHIPKLFDLYFSTKHQGMGIGLSICRTIIEAHGGNISAKNRPDGGAIFQIKLPVIRYENPNR